MMFTSIEKKILKKLGSMTARDQKTKIAWRRLTKSRKRGDKMIVDARLLITLLRELSNPASLSVCHVSNVENQNRSDTMTITTNRFRFVGSASHAISSGTN